MSEDAESKEENVGHQEEGAAAGASEGASESGQMTEEELRAELEKQFRQQQVADVLMQYMVSLSTLAYLKMGITEGTEEDKDLEQARLAIDSFKGILDSVGDRFEKQNREALAGALASMQVTFVQVSGGSAESVREEEAAKKEDTTEEKDGNKKGDGPASRLWVPGNE